MFLLRRRHPACGNAAPPPAQTAGGIQGRRGRAADDAGGDGVPGRRVTAALVGKWTGDLDGMIERRVIRVLTVYSKTTFFVDKGAQLGLVVDALTLFEDDLNKKLKAKHVRVHVISCRLPPTTSSRRCSTAAGTSWPPAR